VKTFWRLRLKSLITKCLYRRLSQTFSHPIGSSSSSSSSSSSGSSGSSSGSSSGNYTCQNSQPFLHMSIVVVVVVVVCTW
jgi:hypothetical protein